MRKKQKKLYICISVNYILQFRHIENTKNQEFNGRSLHRRTN